MMTEQTGLAILILIVLAFVMLWLRAKLAPKPDYTDAVNDVLNREPNWYEIQQQELTARQDMDFRAGR